MSVNNNTGDFQSILNSKNNLKFNTQAADEEIIGYCGNTEECNSGENDDEILQTVNSIEDDIETGEMQCASGGIVSTVIGNIIDIFDGDTKDGEIENTNQGKIGDCWLVASINALSYTQEGQNIIKNALSYEDNSTIVHLAAGDVEITDDEVKQAKGSLLYSSGDDDMIIFELAVEKIRDKISEGEIEVEGGDSTWYILTADEIDEMYEKSNLDGGYSLEAFYLLTGIVGNFTAKEEKIINRLDTFMENEGQDYVLTASLSDEEAKKRISVEDVDGKNVKLTNNHAYSIKYVDEDTVTIVNPLDSDKEITLTRETFLETFTGVSCVDLSKEASEEEYYIDNSGN